MNYLFPLSVFLSVFYLFYENLMKHFMKPFYVSFIWEGVVMDLIEVKDDW